MSPQRIGHVLWRGTGCRRRRRQGWGLCSNASSEGRSPKRWGCRTGQGSQDAVGFPFVFVPVFGVSQGDLRGNDRLARGVKAWFERIEGVIVAAATTKKESVYTCAQVPALCFDALPNEHTSALFADGIGALLWMNLHWLTCSRTRLSWEAKCLFVWFTNQCLPKIREIKVETAKARNALG